MGKEKSGRIVCISGSKNIFEIIKSENSINPGVKKKNHEI